jgi:hypothetical protein
LLSKTLRMASLLLSTLALVGAIGVAGGTTASADVEPAACSSNVIDPYKDGTWVKSLAWSRGGCVSGWRFTVLLQRKTTLGWSTLDTAIWNGDHSEYLTSNCAGTGTHTYRTHMTARNPLGVIFLVESGHVRITC